MGDKSKITWTDASFNCVRGCTKLSLGCENCYAVSNTWRMASNPNPEIQAANQGLVSRNPIGELEWTGEVRVEEDRLSIPEKWKKPRLIFVNSLADTFHRLVPDAFLRELFKVMGRCPQHRFQVLTKRADRMRGFIEVLGRDGFFAEHWKGVNPLVNNAKFFPNVYLGTTVENQQQVDARLYDLAQTPAAVRFISFEPLLGPINLSRFVEVSRVNPVFQWFIAGCESGPEARTCEHDWARGIRGYARGLRIPFHLKQLMVDGKLVHLPKLDGVVHNEFPEDDFFKEKDST